MEDFFKTNNNSKQAIFNAGIAKLQRIDHQKKIISVARHMKHWDTFGEALFIIRSELNERLTKEERNTGDNYEKTIKRELTKSTSTGKILTTPFIEYERFLNDIEYKYGLSMPDKTKETEALMS